MIFFLLCINILNCNCHKLVLDFLWKMANNKGFCAIVLYLFVYYVCFQDGKLSLLVANDKLDGK
jgi:hypothetical protein